MHAVILAGGKGVRLRPYTTALPKPLDPRRLTPGLPLGFDELVLDLPGAQNPPHAHEFDGYWPDIARPDDHDRANAEFTTRKSLLLKGA